MHDPDVVAFEIRRPWPRRDPHTPRNARRWEAGGCFWMLAGRRYYWPGLITVWHREPGGQDSGEVCKHYRREQLPDGTYRTTWLHGWRWHVHHWRVQVHPLQALRRRIVDRCSWCGGRDTKTRRCNISAGWDSSRAHWWTTARGIYHDDCHTAWSARLSCSCPDPIDTGPWSTCARCGLKRYDKDALQREANRCLVEMVPPGTPPAREVMNLVRNLWAVRRASQDAS